MRRFRLLYFALALSSFVYSGGSSDAWAHMGCAVQLSAHPHATVFLWGRPIAHCVSGGAGCKCVSCWALGGGVHAACYPLLAPINGGAGLTPAPSF
jgi:hypothetical protein